MTAANGSGIVRLTSLDGSVNIVDMSRSVDLSAAGGVPGPTGPTGPAGATGPTGATGPVGPLTGGERATFAHTLFGVASETLTLMPWTLVLPDDTAPWLDLTDPNRPVAVESGVYAVTAGFTGGVGTTDPTQILVCKLCLGENAGNNFVSGSAPLVSMSLANPAPGVTLAQTYYMAAGDDLFAQVAHTHTDPLNIGVTAFIVRL